MNTQRGFTLVELSIVLVILGLLIGGVLTGQSLIRAAELRSVSTQYSRHITAAQTFRDKYFALPGDMTNATAYWGVANATPATCVMTASTTALTCNGNGDGQLMPSAGSNENFRFWQHLTNAGLIEGSYSGIQQGSTDTSSTTANAPAGRISASLWFAQTGAVSANPNAFDGPLNNYLLIGGVIANSSPRNPILKAGDTYNIDTKLDDGMPGTGTGKVQVYAINGLATCTTTASGTTYSATYLLSSAGINCALYFKDSL